MTTVATRERPHTRPPSSAYEAAVVHGFNQPLTVEQVQLRPAGGPDRCG